MKKHLTLLFLLTSTFLSAQSADILPDKAPADNDATKEQAEFLLKNVPAAPLPAGNPKLDKMRERSRALLKKHAAYVKAVAEGKIDPYEHIRKLRPKHTQDVLALKQLLEQFDREKDADKKAGISRAIFAAMQPIGVYLEYADPGKGYANKLNKSQQQELTRLEKDWQNADRDYNAEADALHFTGPGQLYTLTNIGVPLAVKAPPSSTVIFQTHGGGMFGNRLALIAVKANEAGIARAEWVTYGDSIADTVITARSLSAPPAQNLTITVAKLKLSAIPEVPATLKKASVPVAPKIDNPAESKK